MNMLFEVLVLAGIGSLAGTFGGLLGVGGSVIMIPGMILLFGSRHGMEAQHLYMAAAMIVNIFVAMPSAYRHNKAGAMLPPVLKVMIPAAICGSVAGVLISNLPVFSGPGALWLSRIFGAFLIYVAGYNFWRLLSKTSMPEITPEAAKNISKLKIALVGLPVGLSGGLLGIGGGALAVPLQQIVLRIPLQRAIANSSLNVFFVSIFGATLKNYTLSQHFYRPDEPFSIAMSLGIAAILIPTAFVGGYVGGFLTHWLPRHYLRLAFICLMLYGGYRLLTRRPPGPVMRTVPATQPAPSPASLPESPPQAASAGTSAGPSG